MITFLFSEMLLIDFMYLQTSKWINNCSKIQHEFMYLEQEK